MSSSSKIEAIITEIEEYIDSCKFQPLSTTKIIVNKEDIEELLAELRLRTPEEIKKYQKIIANKDAILNDARERSEQMLSETAVKVDQLASEHEIMQQAYAKANAVVDEANRQAQQVLDSATTEANDLRSRAMQYTDEILATVQNILSSGMNNFEAANNQMMSSLSESFDVVIESRKELGGLEEPVSEDDDDEDIDITLDD